MSVLWHFCDFFSNTTNLAISLLFIAQRAVKAQIIVKIVDKMLHSSEKNNLIDFPIKFLVTKPISTWFHARSSLFSLSPRSSLLWGACPSIIQILKKGFLIIRGSTKMCQIKSNKLTTIKTELVLRPQSVATTLISCKIADNKLTKSQYKTLSTLVGSGDALNTNKERQDAN